MADPLSILAVLGLAYAGRKLSEEQAPQKAPEAPVVQAPVSRDDNRSVITTSYTGAYKEDPGETPFGIIRSEKFEQPSFGEVAPMKYVNGEPVHDFRDRPYVSGKMNNLSPAEKQLIGPGLGVGPDVPAYGGYQQLFRVKPNNVGAYRLTTLPGRAGPAQNITGGMPGVVGELTHNAPEKTAFLPSRYPNVRGRAQGQGGALEGGMVRERYEKTKRPTNRSETSWRNDGLGYAPAKKFISAGTMAQDPTRNKGDDTQDQFMHVNNAAPGISNFIGGYTVAPNDIRLADKRGKEARAGNAGRMNVRAGPLNAGGQVTAVRSDCNRMDGHLNPANGGWTQNYMNNQLYNFNAFKGNVNPHATTNSLNVAKNQLDNNPFAHSLS